MQPAPSMAPPPYTVTTPGQGGVVEQQPTELIRDPVFLAKLNHIRSLELRQGNVLLEAVTLGIWPNVFTLSDTNYSVPVQGDPDGKMVYRLEAEGSGEGEEQQPAETIAPTRRRCCMSHPQTRYV